MNAKHTPGPWTVPANGHVIAPKPYSVVIAFMPESSDSIQGMDVIDANARLIAAAPDLLQALQGLVSSCELNLDELEPDTHAMLDCARAALAKATGKT